MTGVREFPKVGIAHPVVQLLSYRKMSVTTEEFNLVMAYRRQRSADLQRAEEFLQACRSAVDAHNNFKA